MYLARHMYYYTHYCKSLEGYYLGIYIIILILNFILVCEFYHCSYWWCPVEIKVHPGLHYDYDAELMYKYSYNNDEVDELHIHN